MKQAKLELCGGYRVRRTSSPRELSRVKGDWLHPLLYRVAQKTDVKHFEFTLSLFNNGNIEYTQDYPYLYL